ncbi:MAG: ribosomal protein S18-alanine N-acetyltransferase [Nannocystaceae bacterium]|nr:ribosomal protein S18-alanine N-acetyltransferase [bacterium]
MRRRIATASDLEAILRIESRVFGNPWAPRAYLDEIERPMAIVELAVAEDGAVSGYSCTWHVLAAGEMEAHLLRIAVDPDAQRRGIGRDLLGAVLERATAHGASRVLLEVGASNRAARALYDAAGFAEIGRRAGYYKAPPDDAVVMARPAREAAKTPRPAGC